MEGEQYNSDFEYSLDHENIQLLELTIDNNINISEKTAKIQKGSIHYRCHQTTIKTSKKRKYNII